MTAKSMRIVIVLAVLVASACLTVQANAQCCGAAPTTAYYQPAAYTAYSPVAYQTARTGWYPGYFLDRISARLWGSPSTYVTAYPSTYVASYPSTYVASYPSTYVASYPSTYVASYPSTYVASYPSTYVASYPSSYVASYPSTYTASYAPSYSAGYASSYSPCATCAPVQQVTMRPACECDPCSSCASCGVSGVSQASYQSGGCASCGVGTSSGTTIVVPNGTVVTPGTQQGAPSNGGRQPELAPGENVAPERTYQRPVNGSEQQEVQPEPGSDTNNDELEKVLEGEASETSKSSTYFEPPKLFNPNDRTAARNIGPVRTAIYKQRVSHIPISAPRTINAQQAQRDAAGWVSASR